MMLSGTAYWAKVVGAPAKAYTEGEFEWTIDIAVDKKTVKTLNELGVGHKVRNKGDDRGDFITFRRKSKKRDGTDAKPINIVGPDRKEWDGKTKIGNGSTVNAKFIINEHFGKKSPSLLALQVVKLVPYEGGNSEEFPDYNDESGVEQWD